jgi:putative transcriptional regulator
LPEGAAWPQALAGRDVSRWKWIAPGMHFASVATPDDDQGSMYLLRLAPGRSLARHTHTGIELTQVLCGAFDDGRAVFAEGDFDAADAEVGHSPAVHGGQVCVCLSYVRGRLAFDGILAGMLGRAMGL